MSVVAASPSGVAIRASLQRNESSGDVSAGVVALGQQLVMFMERSNLQHLRYVRGFSSRFRVVLMWSGLSGRLMERKGAR